MKGRTFLALTILFCAFSSYAEEITIFDSNSIIAEGDIYDTVVVKDDGTVVTMTGGTVNKLITINASTFDMLGGSVSQIIGYDVSILNLSGGQIESLNAYSHSNIYIIGTVNITGTAYFYGSSVGTVSSWNATIRWTYLRGVSTLNLLAGTISGYISIEGISLDCTLNISGGTVPEGIEGGVSYGSGTVNISGGFIKSIIFYNDDLYVVNIIGYNLDAIPYDGTSGFGQVKGYWNDDTVFLIDLLAERDYGFINLYDGVIPLVCEDKPGSDSTGDCKVDMADLSKLAAEWLKDGNQ